MKTFEIRLWSQWLQHGDMHVAQPVVYIDDEGEFNDKLDEVYSVIINNTGGRYDNVVLKGQVMDPEHFPKGEYYRGMGYKAVLLDINYVMDTAMIEGTISFDIDDVIDTHMQKKEGYHNESSCYSFSKMFNVVMMLLLIVVLIVCIMELQ